MRGSLTASLSRLTIVALLASSFTVPLILDVSPAMARASNGTAGAAGASGGGGGGGGSAGAGGVSNLSITSVDPVRDPPPRFRAQTTRDTKDSCYQSQPMFDRWGNYVGKQQLPDFCY
jgi:hypothetical protein